MAFRTFFDVSDSYSVLRHHTPLELIHTVQFGEDASTGQIVSICVHLMTNPPFDCPENCMELMFSIVVVTGDELAHMDDGRDTKSLLVGENRELALRVICVETMEILKIAQPDVVTMATVVQGLSEKALRKYDVISAAIRDVGYRGGRGDSFERDHVWMFEKLAPVE